MIRYKAYLAVIFLGLCPQITFAEIPRTINYQGVLQDANGEVVADGNYTLRFTLSTSATNSAVLWEETHENVEVQGGVFNVVLGSIKPIEVPFDQSYYLGISVNGGPELSPRIELTASPYSFRANSVADSSVSGKSIAEGHVVRSINSLSDRVQLLPGDNVTITENDTSLTISAATGGGSGDITAVTAGNGLTGGGESGDVELAIAEKGVTFDMLADSVVSGKKIAEGQVLRALTIGPINSLFPVLTDSARLTFGSNLTMGAEAFPPGFLLNAVADGHSLDAPDGSPSDAVCVDDDGNVGIGTATPDAALDVQGSARVSGDVTVADEVRRPTTGDANMVPICYGNVASDGSINTGTDNFSVSRLETGRYEIAIENEPFTFVNYIVTVTPATPRIVSYNNSVDNKMLVEIIDTDGSRTDASFSFVVYKP